MEYNPTIPPFCMGPVCWRQCVPFQIIRCIFLYICFPSLHVSQTRKRFSPASLPLYAPGYPSHVWVSRSLLQHSHSAAWCIIQFLLWLRHSNVADWHVQSVNPELVTSGTLRTVARSTVSLQYSQKFRTSRRFYSFSLSRGFFFRPVFTLHIPLEVQHRFLIIC